MTRRNRIGSILTAAVAAIFLLTLGATRASADTLTFDLTATNLSGYTGYGPFVQVGIDLTSSTTATITFTSLTNNGNIYLLGSNSAAVSVNVNATPGGWTIGSLSGSNAGTGFTPGPLSDGGSGNQDGFGSFNQQVNSFDGFTHSSDTISFVLTDTSGTWSSAGNVLVANASGYVAGAHIFVTASPADAANGAVITGDVTGDGTATVAEPTSIALLGGILAFTAHKIRRRKVRTN